MDQKIIEFIGFMALNAVMVERLTDIFKVKIISYVSEPNKKMTIQLLTILVSTAIVSLNIDTMIFPEFINKTVAYIFAIAGSSSGSSMWNDILTTIQNKKLTTK